MAHVLGLRWLVCNCWAYFLASPGWQKFSIAAKEQRGFAGAGMDLIKAFSVAAGSPSAQVGRWGRLPASASKVIRLSNEESTGATKKGLAAAKLAEWRVNSEKCRAIIEIKWKAQTAAVLTPAQELRRMNGVKPQSGPGQRWSQSQSSSPPQASPSPLLFPFNLQHFALWPKSLAAAEERLWGGRRRERREMDSPNR